MDLDLQAQHVLQLVLRPGTFPIREIDQRHGLGSPAEDKGDGVPLVEFFIRRRGGGLDDVNGQLVIVLLLGLLIGLDVQFIFRHQILQDGHGLVIGHGLGGQVRHGAHVLTGADPDVDGDGQLTLLLRVRLRVLADDFTHGGVAGLGARHHHLEGAVRHAGLLVGLLLRHAHQFGYGVGVRRRRDKGGEDGPEQEEQDHHDHYGTAADQRDLLAAAEAGGLFVLVAILLPPASPLIGGLPALPVELGRHSGAELLSGLVGLLRPQVGQLEVQIHAGVLPKGLQICDHRVCGGVALLQIRCHGLHADQLQLLGDVRIHLPGSQGHGAQVLDGHGYGAVPLKGQAAGEHLIQHHAGGIDVAAGVGAVPAGLLRRDVVDGAQSLLGQGLGGVLQAGDAEVGYLHAAVPQHHHVLGLDIPVDDAPAVGVAEAPHDLCNEVQRLPPVQLPPLLHVLLQRDAVDQLHDDILDIAALGHVVHRYDVGVRQLGDCLGFCVEPAAEVLVLGQVALENLDGHQAVQPVALGLVHNRHAPGADTLQNLIAVVQHFSNIRVLVFHVSPPFTVFASGRP